ncbi:hypothetical protein [Parablautia muri]|uniref:Uncharacterized protein n=1 Tax=Parablautia muri TaxID=2320879 RepID=A0A9X5BF75_9FIRM|nr:hypothetical protein [Parablautia muri]NBJ92926.1 hypothetical protein [Parablautia muri]
MSRFATADKIESVTAHEVININKWKGSSVEIKFQKMYYSMGYAYVLIICQAKNHKSIGKSDE